MDIITECGSVTFEAATEEIRKIKDGLDSPAGSLTFLDAVNLGENTSFAASTPLSNFSPGSSQLADGKNKTNSLSVRDAMWKLKPTDASLKRPSSYPTRPEVAGIRKTGSSRSVEARSQSTLNLNVASSSKEINHIITPAVASTSKAKNDTETL
ncbi:hypothetical protein DAPPUDRAFT_245963 [Daphnia pulex]|uniref:Uncharacterized protein n=1 Tax=Daphnia pulex TaxID=6669 RepID=E9GPD6_DAPPU|nr:hypothetical protein DAPPUDRAFT_245963 [Daphnia pulex]|eukprot:EFX78698.1 hypothetical protein DAPPUDRAFT_245963 [Daphnia pulex]